MPFDQLRSYILAELRAFAGGADQHDDMTMILMKIEASTQPPLDRAAASLNRGAPAPVVIEAVASVVSGKAPA